MATLRKPMINANAPVEVIVAQIRSYLYQFSDDVAFAFDSGMASDSGVRTEADIQAIAAAVRTMLNLGDDKPTDYVSDNGVEGGWTWRKWASGTAEAWGNFYLNVTEWTYSGGVYTYDGGGIALVENLFKADDVPLLNVGISGTSELVFIYNPRIDVDGTERIINAGIYAVPKTSGDPPVVTAPPAPLSLKFDISAVGKWK